MLDNPHHNLDSWAHHSSQDVNRQSARVKRANTPKINEERVQDQMNSHQTIDRFPIPLSANREGYGGDNDTRYLDFGLRDFYRVSEFISLPKAPNVLDMGGCTGRVLRHFANHDPQGTYVVSEINPNYVSWVNKNMDLTGSNGPKLSAVTARTDGILPFQDNYFDLIMGFSIFTHVDYNIEAIQREIFRVLKPGGKIWFTFHSEYTWYNRHGQLLEHLLNSYPGYPEKGDNWERSGFLSFRKDDHNPYMCQVFETCDHMVQSWGRTFSHVGIIANGHGTHDVIIGSKP